MEIRVDLKKEIALDEHPQIEKQIKEMPEVKTVAYVSEEQAYEKVEGQMGKDASVLEVLDENPFPARFVVTLHNPKEVKGVASEIEKWGISESVQFGEGFVEKFLTFTTLISKFGYYLTLVFTAFAVYIVGSVIKLNIDRRRDEIQVKRLTGSGMFTIRFPFVLEALIITTFASLIGFFVFRYAYDYGSMVLENFIPYITLLERQAFSVELFYYLIGLSFFIGVVGSSFTTKRFLKRY